MIFLDNNKKSPKSVTISNFVTIYGVTIYGSRVETV